MTVLIGRKYATLIKPEKKEIKRHRGSTWNRVAHPHGFLIVAIGLCTVWHTQYS